MKPASTKFMQVLEKQIFGKLKIEARKRGVTVQELLRVIVVPDWLKETDHDSISRIKISEKTRKGYEERLTEARKLAHPKRGKYKRKNLSMKKANVRRRDLRKAVNQNQPNLGAVSVTSLTAVKETAGA